MPPPPETAAPPPGREAAAAGSDFGPDATRPSSLWPDSTRPADVPSSSFATPRLDARAGPRERRRARSAATFDVCHPALALLAVLLVQAALAIVALAGARSVAEWGDRQAAAAFGGVAATLLWLVAVCALRRMLARAAGAWRVALALGLGGAAALAAWAPLAWAGLAPAGPLRGAAALAAGIGCAGLLWAWLDLRARIWQPVDAAARLAELQSRIRPHFLFNALNTALALVRVDPARAESVLEDLAQLFRVALAEAGASVSLQEEIDLARRYLAIEQARFGERLRVQWEIDERVCAARVPPLVLQPLVENAVRHGIEPAPRGGLVVVRVERQRAQAVVTVSNTLGESPGSPGHGMALHNLRERLRLLHDVGATCEVWREARAGGDLFHARLVLPAP